MMLELSENNIIQACRLLFRPDIEFNMDYINGLNRAALKSAYRNKIFESHPDRARYLGLTQNDLEERFKEIDEAYRMISSYLAENTGSQSNPQKNDCNNINTASTKKIMPLYP